MSLLWSWNLVVLKKPQSNKRVTLKTCRKTLDELEQHTRKNSLEFHGIPEDVGIPTNEIVCKVSQAVGVEMEPEKNRDFTSLKQDKKESNQ